MTQYMRGTPRTTRASAAARPHIGGLVETRMAPSLRVVSAGHRQCAMKTTMAATRSGIEDLPKLDQRTRRIWTPSRVSRRG